jgi:hypothetical protein
MAVPPTPGSLLGSSRLLAVWGTPIESGERSPVDQLAALLAARFEVPIDDGLKELAAMSPDHRYVISELLGESRHSAVYAAVDCMLARVVAVKIHRAQGDDADTRVLTEVRAASQIDHPNIVQVYDLGKYAGWLYSVTELCDEDMNTYCLRHGWMDVLERILEAGEGLARLHEIEIVHGDVKPANILIKGGVAKLADFGLVSAPGRASTVVGTPGFIAPEVATGHRSAAGDVFALAATAWSCLFGGLPFGSPPPNADANAAITVFVERAMEGEFGEPLRTRAGMPDLVREVIQHGLCWDPEERPSLEDWLGQLRLILDSARRIAGLRERVRRPQWIVGAAFVAAVVAVGGYLGLRSRPPSSVATPTEAATVPAETATTPARAPLHELAIEAAEDGDGMRAVGAFNEAYAEFDRLAAADQVKVADAATWVAKRLDKDGKVDLARVVWQFALIFHSKVGQLDKEAEAKSALDNRPR